MKRIGYVYDKMANKALIRQCIINGSVGKRKRWDVKLVMEDVDGYTNKIYDLVVNHSFVPTIPKSKTIKDKSSGKERCIKIVPYYPDGIMHWLIVEVLRNQVFMHGMYRWSCASIPKRGNMAAVKYMQKAMSQRRSKTKYCAKMDIRHYYQSINADKLMAALEHRMKDKEMLRLIRSIIDSDPDPGLSIGYYINQWLANYYLQPLDHYIASLGLSNFYIRNMDDLVLLGPNKKKLHLAVRLIQGFLGDMGLTMKANWQVFKVDSRGVDFVGYRFFHGYTILRKRNFLKLTRQSRRIQKKLANGQEVSFHAASGMLSRAGQLKHCNGFAIKKRYIDIIGENRLKDIVRKGPKVIVADNTNIGGGIEAVEEEVGSNAD